MKEFLTQLILAWVIKNSLNLNFSSRTTFLAYTKKAQLMFSGKNPHYIFSVYFHLCLIASSTSSTSRWKHFVAICILLRFPSFTRIVWDVISIVEREKKIQSCGMAKHQYLSNSHNFLILREISKAWLPITLRWFAHFSPFSPVTWWEKRNRKKLLHLRWLK